MNTVRLMWVLQQQNVQHGMREIKCTVRHLIRALNTFISTLISYTEKISLIYNTKQPEIWFLVSDKLLHVQRASKQSHHAIWCWQIWCHPAREQKALFVLQIHRSVSPASCHMHEHHPLWLFFLNEANCPQKTFECLSKVMSPLLVCVKFSYCVSSVAVIWV